MNKDDRQPVRVRCRQTAALFWSGLILLAALLLSRRAAGGLTPPRSLLPFFFATSVVAGLSLIAWVSFRLGTQLDSRRRQAEWVAWLVTLLPTVLIGIVVMPAQSPFAIGWLFGSSALLAGLCAVLPVPELIAAAKVNPGSTSSPAELVSHESPNEVCDPKANDVAVATDELSLFEPSQPNVTQWMSRQNLPDGGESLEGSVRVPFAAGQRAASIHIPFTPPFAAAPEVECEVIGDEDVRWKVSVAYPYGMRVELKRDLSAVPGEVELAYNAACQSTQSDAA